LGDPSQRIGHGGEVAVAVIGELGGGCQILLVQSGRTDQIVGVVGQLLIRVPGVGVRYHVTDHSLPNSLKNNIETKQNKCAKNIVRYLLSPASSNNFVSLV